MTRLSFATLDHRHKKKQTKRERFLSEMDAVVPWAVLMGLIEPHYPKAGKGRPPYPLDVMLRIYFLQQWYQLSDLGAEEALYDIQLMRAFAGLERGCRGEVHGCRSCAPGGQAALVERPLLCPRHAR